MGRPPSDLDDYLEWQQRLESQKESGLSLDVFCLRECFPASVIPAEGTWAWAIGSFGLDAWLSGGELGSWSQSMGCLLSMVKFLVSTGASPDGELVMRIRSLHFARA